MPELRVAIVYDCLYPLTRGGGERVYRAMADVLVEAGHEVEYVTRRQWEPGDPPTERFSIVGVSSGELYGSDGTRSLAGALRFSWGVFRHFSSRRTTYDLIIASALPVLTVLAVRLARIARRGTVVADWLEVWTWPQWRRYAGPVAGALAWVLQFLGIWSVRHHTANSEFTAARIRRVRPAAAVEVLQLTELAGEPHDPSPAGTPPFVIVIGRLIDEKRVPDAIHAFAHARDRRPDLRLRIVGAGPDLENVRQAIVDARAEDGVDLLGRVDDDTLEELLPTAAVHLSASQREGFGLVVTEAARVGVPSVIVAGPDNAASDLIEPGVNGFMAETSAPADLGQVILDALDAGAPLRTSTAGWFARARRTRTLLRSLERVMARAGLL